MRVAQRVLDAYFPPTLHADIAAVLGLDLRIGNVSAGLEAAHIQWHTAGGPDVEANGLSLCALHHKLFDLGAFTLEPVACASSSAATPLRAPRA